MSRLVLSGIAVAATDAVACPFCDGGPSGINEVKAIVFGPDFWANIGLTTGRDAGDV